MPKETIVRLMLPYPDRGHRMVRVYLPARKKGERFPVIYMTDGQNLFDKRSSTFGCWRTMQAVRKAKAEGLGGAVIVGIHNGDPWRVPDLTPASIGPLELPPEAPSYEPLGERFDDFLIHTLIPAVESRFPVLPGRNNRAFCGSSMGGLFALFTAMRHQDIWCAAGVFSPALMLYPSEDLERWIREQPQTAPPFLQLYSGKGDPLERTIAAYTETAAGILESCWPEDRLQLTLCPSLRHHETAWEPQFRALLRRFLTERDRF